MNKLILGILMIAMATSCIYFIWDREPSGEQAYWYLKNTTEKTLSIYTSESTNEVYSIPVGDSVCIYMSSDYYTQHPKFNHVILPNYIRVHDDNGNELCTWSREEIKDGQRDIYEKEFWTQYNTDLDYIWVFDIINKDLIH